MKISKSSTDCLSSEKFDKHFHFYFRSFFLILGLTLFCPMEYLCSASWESNSPSNSPNFVENPAEGRRSLITNFLSEIIKVSLLPPFQVFKIGISQYFLYQFLPKLLCLAIINALKSQIFVADQIFKI